MNDHSDRQEELREVRKALGLTQEEMGGLLGVGRSYYNGLETGRNKVTDQMIMMVRNFEQNPNFAHSELARLSGETSHVGEEALPYGRANKALVTRRDVEDMLSTYLDQIEDNAGELVWFYYQFPKEFPIKPYRERRKKT